MDRWRSLLQETLAASAALALLGTLIAAIFWFATSQSPWPFLVLAESVSFGWGLVLVIVTSPVWRR